METKKTFKFFTIYEYEKEQNYLREMHRSGWKFVKVSGFGIYHFEKCIPEDVIYQLDYNQDGIEHKDEYVKLFHDCGWEYLQDYVGYSYFRKPASQADETEEIFCDNDSKLQMLERVFRGRILPVIILLSCIFIPELIVSIIHKTYMITIMFGAVICLYVTIFIMFALQYWKLKGRK